MNIKSIIFSASSVQRSKGQSPAASMAYCQGKQFRDAYYDKMHYGEKRTDVLCSEILLPPGAPAQYRDGQTLLDAWTVSEKRKDALMAHTYVGALPLELDAAGWLRMIRSFAAENFLKSGFPVFFAIHRGTAREHPKPESIQPVYGERGDNPHVHMLVPFRPMAEQGFLPTKEAGRATFQKSFLRQLRESWAEVQNQEFERQGLDIRVTAKSYKDRGISRMPTPHLGPKSMRLEQSGERSVLGNRYRAAMAENKAREKQIEAELLYEAEQYERDIGREI